MKREEEDMTDCYRMAQDLGFYGYDDMPDWARCLVKRLVGKGWTRL